MKNFKRLFAVLLCVVSIFAMVSTAFATETDISDDTSVVAKLGDADWSDTIDIKDATYIQLRLAEIESFSEVAKLLSDVNGDGMVTIKDATDIQKYIVGISVKGNINSPVSLKTYTIGIRTSDADTGNTVGGYTYGIYADKECTELLEEVSSAPTYVSIYSHNKYFTGTYFIKQLVSAVNYESDSEVYEVNVSEDSSVVGCVWTVIQSKQSPKRLYIKAYDEDNYNPKFPLMEIEFGVFSDKGCAQQICVINNGQYSEKIFEVGKTYYIKDINTAPDGYNSDNVYEVTIPNAQHLDIVAVNVSITACT